MKPSSRAFGRLVKVFVVSPAYFSLVLTAVIYPNYAKYPEKAEADFRDEIQKRITALNKKLPSFKQIRKLEFRRTEFEKTTTRKIKRHLVK